MKQKYKDHPQYWSIHKEIWTDELDTLDDEIRDIIMTSPYDSATRSFNVRIDRLVSDKLKESNNQTN